MTAIFNMATAATETAVSVSENEARESENMEQNEDRDESSAGQQMHEVEKMPEVSMSCETGCSRSPGKSFIDAAWEKFHKDMVTSDCVHIFVPKKGPATITDSGHLILPWRVHMDDCNIREAGCLDNIGNMCSQVTELDLSHNKITSLEEVVKMICSMPKLSFLNISSNPITSQSILAATASILDLSPSDSDKPAPPLSVSGASAGLCPETIATDDSKIRASGIGRDNSAAPNLLDMGGECDSSGVTEGKVQEASAVGFKTVRQLVLNDTAISWEGVVSLLNLFPSVEELHLSLCNYSSIDLPDNFAYPSLKHLYFNNNPISCCSQINQLGKAFPNLQQLFISDTEIACLDEDRMAELFPCLEVLSLNKTKLPCWEEIEKLVLLPALTDVRLQGIPFFEALEEKFRRQQLIARLPNIIRLNSSSIGEEERVDAERAFIRLFMDAAEKPERYYELEKIHGKLDPLAKVDLAPKMSVRVVVVNGSKQEEVEVSVKQTVRMLKKSLQNIAGMPSRKFSLYYRACQDQCGPIKMTFMDKMLYTLNLNDGDEFIIHPL